MLKFRKMRHVRFFLNETLFPLSGGSLVRFFPLVERNEHKNSPINSNLSIVTPGRFYSLPPLTVTLAIEVFWIRSLLNRLSRQVTVRSSSEKS